MYCHAFSVLPSLWEESGIKRDRRRGAHTVLCTACLNANLVSTDILGFMDYFGMHRADDGPKDAVPYSVKSKMFKEENNEEMFLIGGSGNTFVYR